MRTSSAATLSRGELFGAYALALALRTLEVGDIRVHGRHLEGPPDQIRVEGIHLSSRLPWALDLADALAVIASIVDGTAAGDPIDPGVVEQIRIIHGRLVSHERVDTSHLTELAPASAAAIFKLAISSRVAA